MKTTNHSAFTLVEIMIVVAIIGMLAAVVIPNLKRSIDRTQQQACALNRKSVDGAKIQWALDAKKPQTAVPEDGDLFGKSGYVDHKPDCPAGGAYALNAVEEKCTCSVPRHVD
jgi:prepilin-type N-terminal cleavage/methylation domain-containing protein